MTLDQQKLFFETFVQNMKDIMLKKGNDYSNYDRLSNFKQASAIIGISAEKCCLNLMAIKVARLANLVDNKQPENESLQDSMLDLANYTVLLAMIVSER